MKIICLAIGLVILIIINIVLGSLSAMFRKTYDSKKLLRGLAKAGIVVVCFAATYLVGYLNPCIVALEVNGIEVTVMTGIQLVVLVGYYHYAKQVIEKLTAIVKGSMFTEEIDLFGAGMKDCPTQTRGDETKVCHEGIDDAKKTATDGSGNKPAADIVRENMEYNLEGKMKVTFTEDEREK